MIQVKKIFAGLSILLLSGSLLSSCNIKGLFQNYEDDPAWEDPAPAAGAVAQAGGGTAGGAGASVYNKICASCHQGNGQGLPGVYPPLAGSDIVQGDPSGPGRIVLHGFQGKINRKGKEYNGLMAPWKDVLSDQEIADVLTYVRSSWGNKGDAVTPEQVKEYRDKTATRGKGYTEAEIQQPI